MADEPYDPKKHGDVIKLPSQATAAASAEVPYDPKKYGDVLTQPDQAGVHDVGQTVAADRPADARGFRPITEDVLTRMASSLTFGTAEKAAAKLAELRGHGTYEENLIKRRAETEAAGERLGPSGAFAADLLGGGLLGSAAARLPALWGSAAPGATVLGRLAPNAPLPMKILAGSAEGGAYGALAGAGHTDTGKIEDYVKNTLIGGGIGAATGGTISGVAGVAPRLITPFPSTDPVRTQMAQTLRNEGVNVSAGEATGNRILRRTEDVVGNLPFGGDPTHGQMEQLTAAAMKRAGIGGGSRATADVLKDGFKNVGGTIGTIQGRYPVAIDNTALNQAVTIASDVNSVLTQPGEIAAAHRFIDRLTSGQQLDPKAAGELRTQLNKAITGARDSPNYQDVLINIKNSLDDALERTITSAGNHGDVAALNEARRQYANLHVLTDALSRSGPAGELGTLTPSALATALKGNLGKVGYMQGRGDLNELAKASAGLLTAPKSSQSAERWGALEPARILTGIAARPFVNSRMPFGGAQAYWGNQAAAAPIAPSLLQAPTAAGASAAGAQAGPADRLMQNAYGLLTP